MARLGVTVVTVGLWKAEPTRPWVVGYFAESRLVPSWRLGQRDLATAKDFVNDLSKRVKGQVQITTDALRTYYDAPIHAPFKWVLPQIGEPGRCHGTQLFRLHQDSSYTSHIASNGRWRYRSPVERRGFGKPTNSGGRKERRD